MGPKDDAPPPIPFIVGCGRSGTTLLRSMLDSHPEIAIPGEDQFLLDEMDADTPFSRGEPTPVAEIVERMRRYPALVESLGAGLDPEGAPLTLPSFVRTTYGSYASSFGKARYGDKTPGLVLHVSRLAEQIPEAVFVHLVRDGRDVALAFLDQSWGPSTVPRAAAVWRHHVEEGRRAGERLGPGRYLEVGYEELVDDAATVLHRVAALLRVPYAPQMLAYGESAQRAARYSPHPGSHDRLHQPPTKGLRDWRRDMGLRDRIRFESVAGDCLVASSYALSTPGGADSLRAVAALGRAKRRLRGGRLSAGASPARR